MDIRSRRREALILKSRDYREQDKLLFIASLEGGIERVLARGARKPGSALRALAQPYTRAELLLSPAKNGLSFLQEGLPLESYVSLSDGDLGRFAYAAYLSELLLASWPENKAQPELYALALTAFNLLKLSDQHQRTARLFELRLLATQGWLSLPDKCQSCGAPLLQRSFYLSPHDGRLLCENCLPHSSSRLFSAGAIQTARRLISAPLTAIPRIRIPAAINRELEALCQSYLDYHLEYAPRARLVLHELLGE